MTTAKAASGSERRGSLDSGGDETGEGRGGGSGPSSPSLIDAVPLVCQADREHSTAMTAPRAITTDTLVHGAALVGSLAGLAVCLRLWWRGR